MSVPKDRSLEDSASNSSTGRRKSSNILLEDTSANDLRDLINNGTPESTYDLLKNASLGEPSKLLFVYLTNTIPFFAGTVVDKRTDETLFSLLLKNGFDTDRVVTRKLDECVSVFSEQFIDSDSYIIQVGQSRAETIKCYCMTPIYLMMAIYTHMPLICTTTVVVI